MRDRRNLHRRLLEPHFAPEADCGKRPADPSAHDRLVVHIRSGDVAGNLDGDHAQPPCRYVNELIRRGGGGGRPFTRLLVVAEDKKHICIRHLAEISQGVTVVIQSGSLFEDWCSLVTAQHLALSHSEFSSMALYFNRVLSSLHQLTIGVDPVVNKWRPCKRCLVQSVYQSNEVQLCDVLEPDVRVTFYDFRREGFTDTERYFLHYPEGQLSVFGCNDPDARKWSKLQCWGPKPDPGPGLGLIGAVSAVP